MPDSDPEEESERKDTIPESDVKTSAELDAEPDNADKKSDEEHDKDPGMDRDNESDIEQNKQPEEESDKDPNDKTGATSEQDLDDNPAMQDPVKKPNTTSATAQDAETSLAGLPPKPKQVPPRRSVTDSSNSKWVLRQGKTFREMICCKSPFEPDEGEVVDDSADKLSHVGAAAYEVLRKKHSWYHHSLWNVTSGKMTGLDQTPTDGWNMTEDPSEGHSDWFPEKLADIVSKTEIWCDVLSLSPPLGVFMEEMKKAVAVVGERSRGRKDPVIVRMMFGNIVAQPVNCNKVIKKLTEDVPDDANMHVWVGAWRRGVSWNHAKIIAVDGKYLNTGGHNMWDEHYLTTNPVYDLSFNMEGKVAVDAHLFANAQWAFVEKKQRSLVGYMVDKYPDGMPTPLKTRVTVSEFPRKKAKIFPPKFKKRLVPSCSVLEGGVPVISMGRYGNLVFRKRASDDAFVAMMLSAKEILRFAIQDLGPICLPSTKMSVPGYKWPDRYMNVMARVMWVKGVDVEILLSNPNSIPGGLTPMDANYGNGWNCVDVAAEIIKRIRKQFPKVDDSDLRNCVAENLRVSFIRNKQGNKWEDGGNLGMHAKHFIVDDVCTYIGSQNLYMCDLAEWGVVIDDPLETKKIMDEYWNPMWKSSYSPEDCNVQEVMDSLRINREAQNKLLVSQDTRKEIRKAERTNIGVRKDEKNDIYDSEVELRLLPGVSFVKRAK